MYWALAVNRITHLTVIETGILSIICMCCSAHVEFVLKNLIVLYSFVSNVMVTVLLEYTSIYTKIM